MGSDREPGQGGACPFLMPVMADRLRLYPVGAYCRPPGRRVRVPAAATVTCICATAAHLICPAYLAGRRPHPSRRMPR